MSTMIDKLTRTVQESAANGNNSPVDYGDAQGIVRDVLTALLDPTETMQIAALHAWKRYGGDVLECWLEVIRASIQAALDEKEGV